MKLYITYIERVSAVCQRYRERRTTIIFSTSKTCLFVPCCMHTRINIIFLLPVYRIYVMARRGKRTSPEVQVKYLDLNANKINHCALLIGQWRSTFLPTLKICVVIYIV
jgi:hypothetical protein